ncbi:hypothetical protein BJV74DRAFT_922202 [Russula compacta]|nr:hypothetical protein BJV74DRAFT_922202 [Russula compacta]
MAPSHETAGWGPIRSLLCLLPLLVFIPWFSVRELYALPEPITELVDPGTGFPQVSETQILAYVRHLSEDIGYRTVGTAEHALADEWMVDTAHKVQRECERLVHVDPGRRLECEVWHQRGSGSHRFDMMGKRVYKTYADLTNIVIRVSDGTAEGKKHAVLVNAHLDSTLPSPGAADDALAVGVMLECIRVLTHTPGWTPNYSIVFLFNHGEESLQDASHLFSTQHPIAHTCVLAAPAGNQGGELLFQATSEEMIRAYSKVPRPFGTVIANEVFSSGVLLSDTDFRQFEQYLNVTGLDMAVIGNSYVYHTRQDLVENIQPGVAQRMAENTLAILRYLSSDASPLPSLTTGYTRPTTVFFAEFGSFVQYQFATARVMYGTLFSLSLAMLWFVYRESMPGSQSAGFWTAQWNGARALLVAFCGALIGANGLAAIMSRVLNHNMSWFASEHSALLLYGPAALAGMLASQVVLPDVAERNVLTALLLMQSGSALALQLLGIGSACFIFVSAVPLFVALSLDALLNPGAVVSLWAYALGLLVPLHIGTRLACTILDVFVPLTGRLGAEAPAEHIIASIVIVVLSLAVPLITSHERYLHVGAADGAPGFEQLVNDIAANFGVFGTQAVQEDMHDWNGDWDILYPFSSVIHVPYRIPLPIEPGFISPFAEGEHAFKIEAINDAVDVLAGTRSLTLQITHPGLIWTVIAFDAHVLRWTLDDAPPNEYTRHHIKEASFFGVDRWSVDLVLEGTAPLTVNFIGIDEAAMWPAKKAAAAAPAAAAAAAAAVGGDDEARGSRGGRHTVMALFERLDGWLTRETRGRVDVMLLATVGGVVTV